MRRSPRRVDRSVDAKILHCKPKFTTEEPGHTDGGSPSPVVEPVASHLQVEVLTMENIINKAIKLADGILYLEKNKPKSKPSPNLTPKAAKRKRSDSGSPTSVPTPTSTKSVTSARPDPGAKRRSTGPKPKG